MPTLFHLRAVVRSLNDDVMQLDEDVVIAALLHDAVAGHAEQLAAALGVVPGPGDAAAPALKALKLRYDKRVAWMVGRFQGVTDSEHIQALVAEPDAGPLRYKLADLANSAFRLHCVSDAAQKTALMGRYAPAVEGVVAGLVPLGPDCMGLPLRETWLKRFKSGFPG